MKKIKNLLYAAISLAVVLTQGFSAAARAEAPKKRDDYKLTISTSYDYSTGSYDQAVDTSIIYIPVTAKLKYEQWTGKLTVPYLEITGPGVVVGGGEPLVIGAPIAKATESGLGDVIASVGYTLPLDYPGLSADFTGKIKFPTADEGERLGTGNMDYTLQAGLTRVMEDVFLTGDVGRSFNGSSADYRVKDVWRFSAGGGYIFTHSASAGAVYDFRQAGASTGSDFSQITGFITYNLTDNWSAQIHAGSGFTDATPDLSTGIQLSYKFDAMALVTER
ncbi:MAG: transporter [Pseudomonadota bacterium]